MKAVAEAGGRVSAHDVAWAVRFELAFLAVRYAAIVMLAANAFLIPEKVLHDASLLIGCLLAQNLWVHAVRWLQRDAWFSGLFNLLLHLLQVAAIIYWSGLTVPWPVPCLLFLSAYSVAQPGVFRVLGATMVLAVCGVTENYALLWRAPGKLNELDLVWGCFMVFAGGGLAAWLAGSLHVVRRKAEQAALEKASAQDALHALLESVPGPVLLYDGNGAITEANEEASRFLGVERAKLPGRHFAAFLDEESFLTPPEQTQTTPYPEETDAVVLTETGEKKPVLLRIASFVRGRQRGHVAILREEPEETPGEWAATAKEKTPSQEEQFRNAFLNTVIRRMRSPLSAINAFFQLLLDGELGELNEKQRLAMLSCKRSLQRIFDLIQEPGDRL